MTGLLFADTNLLIYSLDPRDPAKRVKAKTIIKDGASSGVLITSPQNLNECYRVLTGRKRIVPPDIAKAFVLSLFPTCRAELNLETIARAWEVEAENRFAWWDCLLLSSAVQAGCSYFLTEDLNDGQTVLGMTLLNPFTNDIRHILS